MKTNIPICLLTIVLLSAVPFVETQQPKKVSRIGFLSPRFPSSPSAPSPDIEGFRQGLRELGYVEAEHRD